MVKTRTNKLVLTALAGLMLLPTAQMSAGWFDSCNVKKTALTAGTALLGGFAAYCGFKKPVNQGVVSYGQDLFIDSSYAKAAIGLGAAALVTGAVCWAKDRLSQKNIDKDGDEIPELEDIKDGDPDNNAEDGDDGSDATETTDETATAETDDELETAAVHEEPGPSFLRRVWNGFTGMFRRNRVEEQQEDERARQEEQEAREEQERLERERASMEREDYLALVREREERSARTFANASTQTESVAVDASTQTDPVAEDVLWPYGSSCMTKAEIAQVRKRAAANGMVVSDHIWRHESGSTVPYEPIVVPASLTAADAYGPMPVHEENVDSDDSDLC